MHKENYMCDYGLKEKKKTTTLMIIIQHDYANDDNKNNKQVMTSEHLFACVCQNFLASCELFQYVSVMVFFLYITYVSDVGIDVILKNRLQIVSE
jgi:hypothetical protein